ncbi:MAG: hypothetical protein PHQ12_02475 [Chthoniobacteraceae bacterium]|nr:hypothetical protein [Chthoniobacteraceae bacterium]
MHTLSLSRFPALLTAGLAALLPLGPAFGQTWEPVPLITAESRAAGVRGGEGCQWPQAIAVEPQQGKRLLFGTDVGGIYRSEDGGLTWQPSNTGLDARGVSAFAFDPANPSRALLVAANSIEEPFHGIYLSTDGGISWKNTQPYGNKGFRDFREQVCFDRTSADQPAKLTRVAYWSAAATKARGPGFFKTENGGATWREIPQTGELLGECILKTHPLKGWIYAGGKNGLYVSRDQGIHFSKVFEIAVTGLDVAAKQPDCVYISTATDVYVSKDSGETFAAISSSRFPPTQHGGVGRLHVSPANPGRMVIENSEGKYNLVRYVTHDGGNTWGRTQFALKQSFIPYNNRQMILAWHPSDPDIAYANGGDFVTRTTDGGKTWAWSNSGNCGLMVGSSFQFNAANPDLVFVPSQDYDGSISSDAGRTWKYIGVSGQHWGGFTYGGYGFSMDRIAAGSRPGWSGKTELRINDGGKIVKTGIELNGIPIGTGDPRDPDIAFLYDYRTADGGKTWTAMAGCAGVLTFDPANPQLLYGAKGPSVLLSKDHGETWVETCRLPKSSVRDIAVDPAHGYLYITSNDGTLYLRSSNSLPEDITRRLPADQFGNRGGYSVATDPVNPSIVYVVRPGNTYAKDTAVVRSTDAGKTWVSLIRSLRLGSGLDGADGGREAMWVRVHPKSRYAYTASNCYGLWRIAPPAQ